MSLNNSEFFAGNNVLIESAPCSDAKVNDCSSEPARLLPTVKPRIYITNDALTYNKTFILATSEQGFEVKGHALGSDLSKACVENGCVIENPTQDSDQTRHYNGKSKTLDAYSTREPVGISSGVQRKPLFRCRESDFFTKLVRRVSTMRTNLKPGIQRVENTPPVSSSNLASPHTPASRKIRRWLSKRFLSSRSRKAENLKDATQSSSCSVAAHEIPSSRKSLSIAPLYFNHTSIDCGSAPTARRYPPGANLNTSESSLLTSPQNVIPLETATLSWEGESGVNGISSSQTTDFSMLRRCRSKEGVHLSTNRQNSTEGGCSMPGTVDVSAHKPAPFSSCLSSPVPSSTPDPGASRYLNVSLAAFGYTNCNRKWVSAQALEADKPDFFFTRHKSTSPPPSAVAKTSTNRRPHVLNLSPEATPISVTTLLLEEGPSVPVRTGPHDNPATAAKIAIRSPAPIDDILIPSDDGHSNVLNADVTVCSLSSESSDQSRVKLRLKRQGTSSATDAEQQRRSLIMLAVSHASPRSHSNSTCSNNVLSPPHTPASRPSGHFGPCLDTSPIRSAGHFHFPGRKLTFDESVGNDLEKVDESPGQEVDIETVPVSSLPIGMLNGDHDQINGGLHPGRITTATTIGHTTPKASPKTPILDGYHFLRQVDELTLQLSAKVSEIEADIEAPSMSEEVAGQLRTTIGKVKLLISQKFVQFRGLCEESITQQEALAANPVGGGEAALTGFITLPSDLDGFWAMVLLQVDDCRAMISHVEAMRQNHWQTPPEKSTPPNLRPEANARRTQTPSRRGRNANAVRLTPSQPRCGKDSSEARNQARERIRAAKREFARRGAEGSAQPAMGQAAPPGDTSSSTAAYLVC